MNYTVCVRELGPGQKPIAISKPFDSLHEADNFAMVSMLEPRYRNKLFFIQKDQQEPILWASYVSK